MVIVAREQTAGRGRHGRVWVSPPGAGLYVSVLLRPSLATTRWPLISLMAAVAVTDAIKNTYSFAADIKWPNDIYAGEKKLGGILAETVETPTGSAVVVGIGINLTKSAFSVELRDVATSVEELTGAISDPEGLLESLIDAIATRYAELRDDGADSILEEWTLRSSFAAGKSVRVALADETFTGVTRGLENDGALRVETDTGEIRTVRAGDVTALRNA